MKPGQRKKGQRPSIELIVKEQHAYMYRNAKSRERFHVGNPLHKRKPSKGAK